jgi:hypothetical protein
LEKENDRKKEEMRKTKTKRKAGREKPERNI